MVLLTACTARAQDSAPLLSGPTVERSTGTDGSEPTSGEMVREADQPPTIVERTFEGTLVELDVHPAAAALARLKLSDAERAATEAILDERARYVSKVARENQDLLLKLQTARRGGAAGGEGRRELMELMREARPLLEPLVRPTLAERLEGVLEEPNREELTRMVGEYMEAYREVQSAGRGDGASATDETERGERRLGQRARGGLERAQAESGLALREIARAFAATVEMRREQTQDLLRAVEATPEQEGQIQQILKDIGSQDGLRAPTPERRREIMERIAEVLTPEQRQRLRTYLRGT